MTSTPDPTHGSRSVNSSLNIHRLLDEAFAGVEVTDEVQDLKEEIRGNLVARVAELESVGVPPAEAAHRAMLEVGDVRAIVDEMAEAGGPKSPWQRQRVRPRPAYVVRTVLLALAGVAAVFTFAALIVGAWTGPTPGVDQAVLTAVVGLIGAALVADGLRQETTSNYPVTRARAIGYAGATAAGLGALGSGAAYVATNDLPWLLAGVALSVASITGFAYLLATQTNRHKPWLVREMQRHTEAGDRFERDPAAASRFGIYTASIWLVALASFVVLGFTAGWAWSWLALLGGLVAMMVTLARMLFEPAREA